MLDVHFHWHQLLKHLLAVSLSILVLVYNLLEVIGMSACSHYYMQNQHLEGRVQVKSQNHAVLMKTCKIPQKQSVLKKTAGFS